MTAIAETNVAETSRPPPALSLRHRNVMVLVLTPAAPISEWFAAFDHELCRAPAFFGARPLVVDVSSVVSDMGPVAAPIVLEGFEARGVAVAAIEGVEPALLAGTPWAGLARKLPGREAVAELTAAPAAPPLTGLLVDGPVRSGQSVVFDDGDVTIIGGVASGAEVLAGGSIHVYGALRGRAIAGLRAGPGARIFCRRLEAELVGIERLYRVAENWGAALHGRPVQVLCERGALRLKPLI